VFRTGEGEVGELDYRSRNCDISDTVVDLQRLAGVTIVRDLTNNCNFCIKASRSAKTYN